ncbi:MAG: AAA family ATPase [Actinomycetota bacterium]|nr:AAA family ATPase [Actinomycetota bacterium]
MASGLAADALFADADVLVCCGSGGVGKTTTAAVIGLEAARRGRRVVVVTIDPAKRLADALGLADGLGPEPQPIVLHGADGDVAGELWAMMLDTAAAFDAVVTRNAGDAGQAERILANPFYRNMAGALSGTQEYMAAETLYLLHDDERFDLVVVDTPPSRRALDFLEAPGVLARFLDHRLFKLLMLPTRKGMRVMNAATQPVLRAIGKVVGSDVLADAVAFFQAFAGMEAGFRERAEVVIDLLRSDATRYVVVASPHRETVAEAAWFAAKLGEQGIPRVTGVVNRVHPPFASGVAAAGVAAAATAAERADDPAVAALWRNVAELRAFAAAEQAELAPFTEALAGAPIGHVPLLAGDVHDLATLSEIRHHLFSP